MFHHPKSLTEAFDKAEGYIVMEEAMNSLKSPSSDQMKEADIPKTEGDQRKTGGYNDRPEGSSKKYNNSWRQGNSRPLASAPKVNKVYTRLNTDRSVILDQNRNQPFFEPPRDNYRAGQLSEILWLSSSRRP